MSIYLGGSRHQSNPLVPAVVAAVVAAGQVVHVGCQYGIDQQVVQVAPPSSLVVFAVAPNLTASPHHVQWSVTRGASVRIAAGGQSAPMPARYLLRSIAAFQGCESAVFFAPGSGSLAVARECVRSRLPVYAFGERPASVPSVAGQWVESSFMGFACWQWRVPSQLSF